MPTLIRWVPYDVNACPVIITTDLNNAHRINVIMDILPQSSHIAKNREWHFGLEPLPFNREKTFMAFSKFGVDDLQYYTGFRVIVLRQLVPPKIFTVFVTFFVFLMCLLMLLPLKHEKLTCIGIFIMASSEMIDEVGVLWFIVSSDFEVDTYIRVLFGTQVLPKCIKS